MKKSLLIELPEFPKWNEAWNEEIWDGIFFIYQDNDTLLSLGIGYKEASLFGYGSYSGYYEDENGNGPIFETVQPLDERSTEEVYNTVVAELTKLYEDWITGRLVPKME